jgi:hypothetical protein
VIVAPDGSSILDRFPAYSVNPGAPGIWRLVAPFNGEPVVVPFAPGIRSGGLIPGERGWFGIWSRNAAADGFELHGCKISEPSRALARTWWSRSGIGHEGDGDAWSNLPPFQLANDPEFPLAFTLTIDGVLLPLDLDWYNDQDYDRGYEYLSCLVREPNTGDLLVGMYRSGNIIVCDPGTGAKKRQVTLPNKYHSSKLIVDQGRNVLWAMGYDTLFRLGLPSLDVESSRLIQGPVYSSEMDKITHGAVVMTGAFAGDMVLQAEYDRICVARPFSGDVQALDLVSLDAVAVAKTGGEPLDLAVIGDEVVARALKTGDVLRGRLEKPN